MDPLQDRLRRMAREALDDPSRASDIARAALMAIDSESRRANVAPTGYTYAGAHTWVAEVRDLAVEPLPSAPNVVGEPGVPIWNTANQPIPIRVPFDSWVYGVASWAVLGGSTSIDGPVLPAFAPTCAEGRDLVAVDWAIDGMEGFVTDGERRMVVPSSVICGTRNNPRMLSWTVQRNQTIQVRFRNLINAFLLPSENPEFVFPKISIAAVAFYAVNLEMP